MPSGNQFAHPQYTRVVIASSAADSSFFPTKYLLGVICLGSTGRYYSVHALYSGIKSSASRMRHRDK